MIPYLRKEKIMTLLHEHDVITIDHIKEHLPEISISTLRRDLKKLEEESLVIMLSGGAVKLRTPSEDLPVSAKETMHKEEKDIIAKLAADLVEDGDVVYLDSGTTCTTLMKLISKKKITIVTSNTAIMELNYILDSEVIFLGGSLNSSLSSVNGPLTDNNIKLFNYDKAFLGANGISAKNGVSTPSLIEANKKASVIDKSKEVYLLCDSSKFNKVFMARSFGVEQCIVISDKYDEDIGSLTKMITPKSKK